MLYCPKREEINPRDLGLGKSQGEVRGSNVFLFNKSNIKYLAKSGGNICSHRNQKQLIGFSSKGFMTIFSMRTKSSLLFTPTEDY